MDGNLYDMPQPNDYYNMPMPNMPQPNNYGMPDPNQPPPPPSPGGNDYYSMPRAPPSPGGNDYYPMPQAPPPASLPTGGEYYNMANDGQATIDSLNSSKIQKSATIDMNINYNLYESLPISRDTSTMSDLKRKANERVPKPRGDFKCQDVPFLILFIVFWIGMLVITVQTFLVAPYDTLLYGRNSYGDLCGTGNYSEYKYIAYFLSTEQMRDAENPIKYKVCTNFCPRNYLLYTKDLYEIDSNNETLWYTDYLDIRNETYSENNLRIVSFNYTNLYDLYNLIHDISEYDNFLIPSVEVFNRCIPDLDQFGKKQSEFSDKLQGGIDFGARVYQSVKKSINIFLMEGGIALGLTFIWLLFTYLFTGIFIWITVIVSVLLLGGITIFSWYIYTQADSDKIRSSLLDTKNPYVNKYLYNATFFLVLSIILSITFVLTALFFVLARKRINFGIRIVEEAGKAVMKYPSLSFIPLVQFILIIGLTIYISLIFIPVTITSRKEVSSKTKKVIDKYTPLKEDGISTKSYAFIIELYVVLGFYWTYYFIKAVGKTTICGTVATWYFTPLNQHGKKNCQRNAITRTFIRVTTYNLGSLAFGSLILGIISVIKYVLAKLQKTAEQKKENELVKVLIKALRCCVSCIDKIVKFITKHAYVEIAIYGYSFCKAAYKATKIIARNAFRVVVVGKIGDLIFSLGKLLVVSITVGCTFLILKNKGIKDTYLLAIPLIVSFVLSLTIISVFMTVLNSAIDTIFICVCEDLERNDGSKEKPYFMSKSLKKLLVKGNQSEKDNAKNMY